MPFQNIIYETLPLGVPGDFASANPYASALAQEAQFRAGDEGVTVGKFVWEQTDGRVLNRAPDEDNDTVINQTLGFVHRSNNAIIVNYLEEATMQIPMGFAVTVLNEGCLLATLAGSVAVKRGDPVYTNITNGEVAGAEQGNFWRGSVGATGFVVDTENEDPTGETISVSGVVQGFLSVGDTLIGTGIPAGTAISQQLSGTPPGKGGVYKVTASTTAIASSATSISNLLFVTGTGNATRLPYGVTLTNATTPSPVQVLQQVTGTGRALGTYLLSQTLTTQLSPDSYITYSISQQTNFVFWLG